MAHVFCSTQILCTFKENPDYWYKAVVYFSHPHPPTIGTVYIMWVRPLYNFLFQGPKLTILNHSFK